MKRSGQCPKCNSDQVGVFSNATGHLAGSGMRKVRLEAYVCGECGLYETYLATPPLEWTPPLAERADSGFRWLERAPEAGPYR